MGLTSGGRIVEVVGSVLPVEHGTGVVVDRL